ncbi:N-acetyltransferase [Aeromicrobium phragmitis]|uniref:N-acetyltransferase n=1 Tax=Aeromicrobium phragmitis TaxID=2478914 RepID=A0A3L8PJ47_9ACTN|nr:GNAT family N-acetyltransferase [Aeromicrobium phragmitis]RLV54713.1 N-acetyltransferase [Aeromicrobium phragmitis]
MTEVAYTLSRPTLDDLPDYARLHGDPAVWAHFPSGRHTSVEQSRESLARDIADWDGAGLGFWIVRAADDALVPAGELLGVAGCRPAHDGLFWNLYYRLSPKAQGHGLARRLGHEAVAAANAAAAERPVVAYLLEHNHASRRTAERVGLTLQWRGPDAGNPDPDAVRLVFADRPLSPEALGALTP